MTKNEVDYEVDRIEKLLKEKKIVYNLNESQKKIKAKGFGNADVSNDLDASELKTEFSDIDNLKRKMATTGKKTKKVTSTPAKLCPSDSVLNFHSTGAKVSSNSLSIVFSKSCKLHPEMPFNID